MTDLQVRYQQLQETKRANREQEKLKSQDVAIKSRETDIAYDRSLAEIDKAQAEIAKIQSDTKLNATKKQEMISNIVKNYMSATIGTIAKAFSDVFGSVLGGFKQGLFY